MVEKYRDKFNLQMYLIVRISGAIGFVCFAFFASWLLDSDFKLSDVSWWRYFALAGIGYGITAVIDKLVPYFEKQREEKERFRAVCTYAPEAISILTLPDLRYHFVNEVAREMIEYISGVSDPIGKKFREVHGDTKSSGTEATFMHLVKSGTSLTTTEVRLKPRAPERREVVCDMKAFPIRDQFGQIAGLVIYYIDVTDKVRARRGAEIANNEKTEFTKRAGGEIYDAIVTAKGKIELLQNNQVANADRGLLYNSIVNSLGDLAKTAREVTELGRLHAGEVHLEPAWFSLGEITQSLAEKYSNEATAKGLRFLYSETLMHLPTVFSDQGRFEDLLDTLFHNAVRLTPKGRIELRVALQLAADDRAIFDYRVIYTGYAQDSIALTYSQKIAKLMGGTLTLEQNKSGAGFVFHFRFETEIPPQSKILEFRPAEHGDEEISESHGQVLPPIKKTGS